MSLRQFFTKRRIESALGTNLQQLMVLAEDPAQWSSFEKTKSGKTRRFRPASFRLREIHERLLRRVLCNVPPHAAAYCVPKRGALEAAQLHAGKKMMLHLDLQNFFPSVTTEQVVDVFTRVGAAPKMSALLAKLTTVDNELPQGAVTSVALANLVLFRLDGRLDGLCRAHGLTYTRYVDDIAISGGMRLAQLEKRFRAIVAEEGWVVGKKGGLMGPDVRHKYLGLVLNASPNVDDQYIADIRLAISRLSRDVKPALRSLTSLKGQIQYITHINPKRGARLMSDFDAAVKKTGPDSI